MDDDRVLELVELALETGQPAEAVCAACPHLRADVERRLREYHGLEARLDDCLPEGGHGTMLPEVPGYRVISTLGTGGMGVVFLAEHRELGRLVAIKMLRAGPYAGRVDRERFMREARAQGALRHPHIVAVHEVGEAGGWPYFAMEYMEGGTLSERIRGQRVGAEAAARIVLALADAVGYAHRHGVIHRDLKPANILADGSGTFKVSDFGIARIQRAGETLTLTGACLGTPEYMAPEQTAGLVRAVGPTADVYGLGAMLHELLRGQPPAPAPGVGDGGVGAARPGRWKPSRIPSDLATICAKCLEADPARRYPTAGELAEDLRRHLRGEPVAARPIGPVEQGVRWSRRHPAASVAVGFLAVSLLGGMGTTIAVLSGRASDHAAVAAAIDTASSFQRAGDLAQSRASIEQARARLNGRWAGTLGNEIDGLEANLALAGRLETIRLGHARTSDGVLRSTFASDEYAAAFQQSGFGTVGDSPQEVGERVRASPIAPALVAALDAWMTCTEAGSLRAWIIETAKAADSDADAGGWRARARSLANGPGLIEEIESLAAEAQVEDQTPAFLYAFGRWVEQAGVDSVPLLERAQRAHPSDFWITSLLGNTLWKQNRLAEAIEYFRAAVALRPDTMVSHYNLGRALGTAGRIEEAAEALREAVRADPGAADPWKSLGLALGQLGEYDEAARMLLRGYEQDPEDAAAASLAGLYLARASRFEESIAWHEQAAATHPALEADPRGLRLELVARGRHALAQRVWAACLDARSDEPEAWAGYAELCLFLADETGLERARRTLLAGLSGASPDRWAPAAAVPLLLRSPAVTEDIEAVRLRPDQPANAETADTGGGARETLARALTAYRSGAYLEAAELGDRGAPGSTLAIAMTIVEAMSRQRLGDGERALDAMAAAAVAMDWAPARAQTLDACVCHVLWREAQGLILPDAEAVAGGGAEPGSERERLAMLAECLTRGHASRWAELWEASSDPALTAPGRMPGHVMCALARAASGDGTDSGGYSEADRERWRRRLHAAAREQIDGWERLRAAASDEAQARTAREAVTVWLKVPELAPFRQTEWLSGLPEDERRAWEELWTVVRAAEGLPGPSSPRIR